MKSLVFGLFGSALQGASYHDVDLFAFGSPLKVSTIQKRLLTNWNPRIMRRLSLNSYGGGGGGGGGRGRHNPCERPNTRMLDVTLFDNESDFKVFGSRNAGSLLVSSRRSQDFHALLMEKANPQAVEYVDWAFGIDS